MRRVRWNRRPPHGVTVAGLVLAGGRGTRMGGRDKGLSVERGTPMAERRAAWLASSCELVVVSANRNLARYARWADVVTDDGNGEYLGPLAGIVAALTVARCRVLVTCPCDASDVPDDLPDRLLRALRRRGPQEVAVARDRERLQPLLMALRGTARAGISAYLRNGGRSVHGWLATVNVVEVPVPGVVGNRNAIGGFDHAKQGRGACPPAQREPSRDQSVSV